MQAAQLKKYAENFSLAVREIPVPEIGPQEVLVKVKAAAVNPLDNLIGTGSLKLIQDYEFPLTMGNELTGIVEKVGVQVSGFQKGDRIYTRMPLKKIGAFAEYAAIDSRALALLPSNLNLTNGAAAALTGLTAYQALSEELNVQAGESLFIPGASGSFGQLAVPLAKKLGAKVIASGNGASRQRVLALGADQYLDYRQENYWEKIAQVDYVIDTLGPQEFAHELSVIKKGGRLLSLRTGPNKLFAQRRDFPNWKKVLFSAAGAKFDRQAKQAGVQYRFMFVRSSGDQLRTLARIIEEEKIVPQVDPHFFKLEEADQALQFVAQGHPQGKVIIKF